MHSHLKYEPSLNGNFCAHGPTLKFYRSTEKANDYFFVCSAYRNRKDCDFFQKEGQNLTQQSKKIWLKRYGLFAKLGAYHKTRYLLVKSLKDHGFDGMSINLCITCNRFFSDNESINNGIYKKAFHSLKPSCNIIEINQSMVTPSMTLNSYKKNTKEAQYFFSSLTLEFLTKNILSFNYEKVICIGTPRLFENLTQIEKNVILMDIDSRYSNFYNTNKYIHYNMCNNHFFSDKAESNFIKFLNKTSTSEKKKDSSILIIIDPPFGVMIEVIAHSIQTLKNYIIDKINLSITNQSSISKFDELFINPYFMANKIEKHLPHLNMSDYVITYENHGKFRKDKSPIRIFTSIPLSNFELPIKLGYKYCKECKYYVHDNNQHCEACGKCTTLVGKKPYSHCYKCFVCVKPYFIHCDECGKCHKLDKHT